jgi:hypothetical protein
MTTPPLPRVLHGIALPAPPHRCPKLPFFELADKLVPLHDLIPTSLLLAFLAPSMSLP